MKVILKAFTEEILFDQKHCDLERSSILAISHANEILRNAGISISFEFEEVEHSERASRKP